VLRPLSSPVDLRPQRSDMVPGVEADELDPPFFLSLQSIDCVGASGDPNLGARTDEGEVEPELRARGYSNDYDNIHCGRDA